MAATLLEDTAIDKSKYFNKSIYVISGADVILENEGESKGQITINDAVYGSFFMSWSSMGENSCIEDFLLRINADYFTDKLLGPLSRHRFDVVKTFAEVRRFIRNDICLPWHKHLEFQKDLRKKLAYFQKRCADEGSNYFVDNLYDEFQTRLDFYLIKNSFERKMMEGDFTSMLSSEPWHFIQTKESDCSKWLSKLHFKIKREIRRSRKENQPIV